ncbi:MAG TPA: thioredoxin [Phycisphaerales bacterium]|nr:thioredoxin [Phycisphaerales bacterium]
MANANVKEFNESNFDAEVLSSQTPVLVDFWAEWCQPCRMLTPVVEALADEFAGKVKVGKVDTDANRNLAVRYNINSIPTIMIFKGGQPVRTLVGFQRKDALAAHLNAAVA